MTVTIDWIENDSSHPDVVVERGDGAQVTYPKGIQQAVHWNMPLWRSGNRMIINTKYPRIWVVDEYVLRDAVICTCGDVTNDVQG